MKTIAYTRATLINELEQIRALKLQNSAQNLSSEEKIQEGFVTVQHTVALLKKMNDTCAHIVAKENDKVVGFALVMLPSFRDEIKVLAPMFERIDELLPADKSYLVMGQICIDKNYRKQGVFRGLYNFYREQLRNKYNLLYTEIAAANKRSMAAHESVGFKTVATYEDDDVTWNIVVWDWT